LVWYARVQDRGSPAKAQGPQTGVLCNRLRGGTAIGCLRQSKVDLFCFWCTRAQEPGEPRAKPWKLYSLTLIERYSPCWPEEMGVFKGRGLSNGVRPSRPGVPGTGS